MTHQRRITLFRGIVATFAVTTAATASARSEPLPLSLPLARAAETSPWCLADQSLCIAVDPVNGAQDGDRFWANGPPVLTVSQPWPGNPDRITGDITLPFTVGDRQWAEI